jgi:hypothetical protein
MPTSPDFVECVVCRKSRRIGRAVSVCNTCDEAMCEKHLDKCTCLDERRQLGLQGVA